MALLEDPTSRTSWRCSCSTWSGGGEALRAAFFLPISPRVSSCSAISCRGQAKTPGSGRASSLYDLLIRPLVAAGWVDGYISIVVTSCHLASLHLYFLLRRLSDREVGFASWASASCSAQLLFGCGTGERRVAADQDARRSVAVRATRSHLLRYAREGAEAAGSPSSQGLRRCSS